MTSRSTSAGKPGVHELAELSLLCALMLAGKESLRVLPNVHPVTLIILLCALVYGFRALYPVFGFSLLEIAIYGAGIWNLMYLYVWPLLVFVAVPLRRRGGRLLWTAVAAMHGLCFGALCAVPYFFIGGWQMALSWWVAGIPFDLIHCASNAALTFFLLPPLYKLLLRLKGKELTDKDSYYAKETDRRDRPQIK